MQNTIIPTSCISTHAACFVTDTALTQIHDTAYTCHHITDIQHHMTQHNKHTADTTPTCCCHLNTTQHTQLLQHLHVVAISIQQTHSFYNTYMLLPSQYNKHTASTTPTCCCHLNMLLSSQHVAVISTCYTQSSILCHRR